MVIGKAILVALAQQLVTAVAEAEEEPVVVVNLTTLFLMMYWDLTVAEPIAVRRVSFGIHGTWPAALLRPPPDRGGCADPAPGAMLEPPCDS